MFSPLPTDVPRETFEKLKLYETLLHKWQAKINLVSHSTLEDSWTRHFEDSLQLLPLIPKTNTPLLDLGSGAGFPGMVLAICSIQNVFLIESDRKKCLFLQEVARQTSTPITILNKRIEALSDKDFTAIGTNLPSSLILVSRACSPLENLLSLSAGFLTPETTCFFHKGKSHDKEIVDMEKNWDAQLTIHPSSLTPESVVVELQNIGPKQTV